ncbi:MAG TPA: hypothetical protein VFW16_15110 [Streptosporangiaceae bacterium]|nr:hypothetical protein [Streptosporangiaceae bacterium]
MQPPGGAGRLVAGRYRLLHQLGRGAMGVSGAAGTNCSTAT